MTQQKPVSPKVALPADTPIVYISAFFCMEEITPEIAEIFADRAKDEPQMIQLGFIDGPELASPYVACRFFRWDAKKEVWTLRTVANGEACGFMRVAEFKHEAADLIAAARVQIAEEAKFA